MPLAKPTKPDAITAVPTPVPLRTDRANFAARGDTMMGWFPGGVSGINTNIDYVNLAANFAEQEANTATTQATASAASATAASASALAAGTSASAALWVTGTTYPTPSSVVAGARVISPTNQMIYADTVGGVSSTDPALDTSARWALAVLPSAEVIGLPHVAPTIIVNGLMGISNVPMLVARASTKGRFDERGIFVYDAAGVLGVNYDPKTKRSTGYRVDPAATYLAMQSEAIAANWPTSNITVTDGAAVGLDGLLSMAKIEAIATATAQCSRQATATATAQYFVVRVKKGSGSSAANIYGVYNVTTAQNLVFCSIDYDTGAVSHIAGSGASSVDLGNGVWELTIPCTSGVSVGNILQMYLCYIGSASVSGDFAYITQPQVSDKPRAPYDPTAASNVTRPADVPVISGPGFTDNWNTREGTILMRVRDGGQTSARLLVEINDTTPDNRLSLYFTGSDVQFNIDVATARVAGLTVTGAATGPVVVAVTWSVAGGARLAVKGYAQQSTTLAAVPVVTQIQPGTLFATGNEFGGDIELLAYSPVATTAAEMQALVNNA